MSVLSAIVSTTRDYAGTRLILLSLVLVAIILLLAGCTIALLTFINQRKASTASHQLQSENT